MEEIQNHCDRHKSRNIQKRQIYNNGRWVSGCLWLGAEAEAGYTHAPGNFGRADESVLGLDHGVVMVVQLCKLTKNH